MAENEDVMFMLGEIKGKLDAMDKRFDAVEGMDKRLRKVEMRAAMNGATTGGIMGVGMSVLVLSIKEALKTQGS